MADSNYLMFNVVRFKSSLQDGIRIAWIFSEKPQTNFSVSTWFLAVMFVFLRALGSFGVARIRGELISEVTRVENIIICSKIVFFFFFTVYCSLSNLSGTGSRAQNKDTGNVWFLGAFLKQ